MSLRNKLLLFAGALVLVPGVLLALIAERSGRDSLQHVIGRQLAREAGHTADRLAAVLRAERDTLSSFAHQDVMREIRVDDIDKRVSVALSTLRSGNPARLAYLVVDRAERVVASSDPELLGPIPTWARGLRRAPAAEGIVGPITLQGFDARILVMTTAIADPDDGRRTLGSLVGLLDWERLIGVTRRVRDDLASQGIAAEVLVSGVDGLVIGGARDPRAPEPLTAELTPVAKHVGGKPDYVVSDEGGLLIGRASLPAGLPAWKLLVVEPLSHALAPAQRLSLRLALTMGLAVAAALVVATLAARRVVRPLSELTRAIRGISGGNVRDLHVPVRTDDEVGTLAVAFNEMASQLDRVQHELVEAEKFAFVGELAAGVAHQIRTSLGVLGSSAQMLARSLPAEAGAEAEELAQMIRAEVARLGGVVSDLLTLDRARSLELESIAISQPVFRAVDFVRPKAGEKHIRVTRAAVSREPKVVCEPELIFQVAVNLLVNAMQALEPGGRIDVRVLEEREGFGGFEIRDDGPGIPEELHERIFQPFVTTSDGGVGLGLTFVKRVVHEHGGRVSVDSQPGIGTCVGIAIPLADA